VPEQRRYARCAAANNFQVSFGGVEVRKVHSWF
jgi:hypothetical protein